MLTIEHYVLQNKITPRYSFWICVYANGAPHKFVHSMCAANKQCVCVADQWSVDLQCRLQSSPFFEALRGAQDTIVMVDRECNVFMRAWW